MKIEDIEVIPLNIRMDDTVDPHIYRSGIRARSQVILYRVQLESGAVGYGEDMGTPDDVSAYIGTDSVAGLRTIRHAGLQMACFDAVGRALNQPAHVLMGRQQRSRVPFAFWTIDLPPDGLAAQVSKAAEQGYKAYKFKLRPWWDPFEQVEAAADVAPPGFELWLDFNGHLRETRFALPILQGLSTYACVGGFESPIPQRDGAGYRYLRDHIDLPIAAHFGSGCCHVESDPSYDRGVPALRQITEKLCDGFVLGSSDVETIRQQAAVADAGHMPFWVQVVGTGLRAAWVAHLTSTCRAGTLSHLAAHNLWQDDIVNLPAVESGYMQVPKGPGLGVTVDEDKVETLRNAPPVESNPARISTVVFADGLRWHFAEEQQRHEAFYFGDLPGFMPGVRLEIWADDGSREFKELYSRASEAPVVDRVQTA